MTNDRCFVAIPGDSNHTEASTACRLSYNTTLGTTSSLSIVHDMNECLDTFNSSKLFCRFLLPVVMI